MIDTRKNSLIAYNLNNFQQELKYVFVKITHFFVFKIRNIQTLCTTVWKKLVQIV